MRIHIFHQPSSPQQAPSSNKRGFREVLERIGSYEKDTEAALARAARPDADYADLLAVQVQMQLWSQSTDIFGRVAGQASQSLQELARSTQ